MTECIVSNLVSMTVLVGTGESFPGDRIKKSSTLVCSKNVEYRVNSWMRQGCTVQSTYQTTRLRCEVRLQAMQACAEHPDARQGLPAP
jgi:hypothetical protein